MAQLQKGFEFDSSNPAKNIVTDDNLNALVANATLLSGAITEQTANSNTADTDIMLLSKAGSLIKQTKGQFTNTINSNIVNVNTVNAGLVDTDDIDTADATVSGTFAVGGTSAFTGNLAVTGNMSVAGSITASGALTSSGTANFTGTFQVNGAVGYVLTEIYEETIPYTYAGGTTYNLWSSASFTKPVGEIWVFEFSMQHAGARGSPQDLGFRYGSQTPLTGNYLFIERFWDANGGGVLVNLFSGKFVVQSSVAMTDTIKFDVLNPNGNAFSIGASTGSTSFSAGSLVASKFRIYKYKTA